MNTPSGTRDKDKAWKLIELRGQNRKGPLERAVETVMVGALASVEAWLGHLWGHGLYPEELTEAQKCFRHVYDLLRKEILDKGNYQILLIRKGQKDV